MSQTAYRRTRGIFDLFLEEGGDIEDLVQHCEACFNARPGTIDRMKYDGRPNKYGWQNPYRIWFLKLDTFRYKFYNTREEAKAARILHSLQKPQGRTPPHTRNKDKVLGIFPKI